MKEVYHDDKKTIDGKNGFGFHLFFQCLISSGHTFNRTRDLVGDRPHDWLLDIPAVEIVALLSSDIENTDRDKPIDLGAHTVSNG